MPRAIVSDVDRWTVREQLARAPTNGARKERRPTPRVSSWCLAPKASVDARHHNKPRCVLPYGSWPSPLSAARVTAGGLRLDQIQLDGDDVYWIEGRASEGGRNVIVKRSPSGEIVDVTPPGFNVRTRVHEYGGGAYTVHRGTIFFSNFADQRVYQQEPGGAPLAITDGRADATPTSGWTRIAIAPDRRSRDDAEQQRRSSRDSRCDRAGRRRRLLFGSDRQPRRQVPGVAAVASSQHAVGRDRVVGRGVQSGRIDRLAREGRRRQRRVDLPAGVVARRRAVLRVGSHRLVESVSLARALRTSTPLHAMAAEFGKPQWTFSMVTYAFVDARPHRRDLYRRTGDGSWR